MATRRSGMNWTPRARRLGRLATTLGVVLIIILLWSMCSRGTVPPPEASQSPTASAGAGSPTPTEPPNDGVTVVWTTGGMPTGFAEGLAGVPEVKDSVTVAGDTAWLDMSKDSSGTVVEDPAVPTGIPMEVYAADPAEYGVFLPGWLQPEFQQALDDGKGILGETSAGLRGIDVGGTLQFGSTEIEIGMVVDDKYVGASELFVSRTTGTSLSVSEDRFALLHLTDPQPAAAVAEALAPLVTTGHVLRVFTPGQSPYWRVGGTTVPPVLMDSKFGDIVGRPDPARPGWIEMDPAWISANIETRTVPLLGSMTCNKQLFPQLIGALQEIEDSGLSSEVTSTSGCYAARQVGRDITSAISQHAWGAAFDINVAGNGFGDTTPDQDPRVVAIFEKWGFLWGGDFAIPDGMHFEYLKDSTGA